ncbi:transmembrane channel-like protein 5 [Sceloporus undulatus]|uniref:transmembrane channel-like protein 5 n=1 Tax=Sceloporus undulatus TaxID=8520 RepID=UPI001C4C6147|nr:transmembrane channel-like protein 5 [Sceloporus undulatus]XP_042293903.1 transmembrane channel-like protein 5 [Sceloporus undulatus]
MSFHYNEAFENLGCPYSEPLEVDNPDNPDYHYADTLELDRIRPTEGSTSFHYNPYDSSPYNSYGEHNAEGVRRQNSSIHIPMNSVQIQNSDTDYGLRDFSFETPSSNPYRNAHINPSFEYEPEFAQTLSADINALNHYYTRKPKTSSVGEEKFIGDLITMSTHERIKAIQQIPKPMKEKRNIRNHVLLEKTKKTYGRNTQINCCTQCFYSTALSFRQFKSSLCDCFQLFKLWQKILKDIGGKFGTSVRSYFAFLTWLLMFNMFSFLVNFSFITVPQLISAKSNNLSFTGLEFFTGAGYFKDTVLYYGFYTNSTVVKSETMSPYHMQLAYIFTIGIYFIVCFLSLLYSMAKSFLNNFSSPQMYSGNAAKLLCIWDFNITNAKAVKLKQKNLSTQIKETLSEASTGALTLSLSQRLCRISCRLVAWAVSLGAAVGSCAGIYHISLVNLEFLLDEKKTNLESEAATLVLPIIVSLINHIVPFFYSSFGFVEKFTHPRHQIYTNIVRNIILKVSIIGILCNYWLNKVALSNAECWETLVGQDIYRLLVADFICCLLGSFFGEFLQRIIGTKCCKKLGVPEFDIARNVLDLIYAQTLTWIGIFYSPLLPAIQMISFFVIFCVKKVSLMMNCQPPRKAWRASQMNTIFVFLLFFPSFAGVLAVIAITVWRLKPSETCGPFRGLKTIFEAISGWVALLSSYPGSIWVVWIYRNLIESVHFFFILSIIVLIITYLYWQIIDGRKIMVKLLQEQIVNEGKDKMFLLKKLHALQASKLPDLGEQPERHSSAHQLPAHQMRFPLPNAIESSPRTTERDYAVPARTSEMTSFAHGVREDGQSARNVGISETLALALRARQEAEWEMDGEEST